MVPIDPTLTALRDAVRHYDDYSPSDHPPSVADYLRLDRLRMQIVRAAIEAGAALDALARHNTSGETTLVWTVTNQD